MFDYDCEGNMTIFDFIEDGEKHKPIKSTDWKWTFSDYPKEKNGLKAFSCFACGGGSTMGYKLAGCEVLGCCEIDPRMNEIYVNNHNPKYNYLMDIREFNKLTDLPEELYNLDILDGSPPCTTFSMAGVREESWGKKKKFREGQAEQTLDDLSFIFIETAAKLQPKCVIMENVEGLIKGEAWGYVQKIYEQFYIAGYQVKHWLLKGEEMGVPQTRHRVFFVALRNDIQFDLTMLNMFFNYEPVAYGDIKTGEPRKINENTETYQLLKQALPTEKCIGDINLRINNKVSGFQSYIINDKSIIPTIRSKPDIYIKETMSSISKETIIRSQTFPEDYQFGNNSMGEISYICGMSVPPIMIKRIVTRLIETGIFAQVP